MPELPGAARARVHRLIDRGLESNVVVQLGEARP